MPTYFSTDFTITVLVNNSNIPKLSKYRTCSTSISFFCQKLNLKSECKGDKQYPITIKENNEKSVSINPIKL